jgi:hypothetical protein
MSKRLEYWFPKLKTMAYSLASPENWTYNCFAFAAGDRENWWDPKGHGATPSMRGYWPSDAPPQHTVGAFIKAYATVGFSLCADGRPETGFEKVAIYVDESDRPTHASTQGADGRWKSKAGCLEDFAHELEALEGNNMGEYGRVVAYMKRPMAI